MTHIRDLGFAFLAATFLTACSNGNNYIGEWSTTTASRETSIIDIHKMDDGRYSVQLNDKDAPLVATLDAGKLIAPNPIGNITYDRDHNAINAAGSQYLRTELDSSEGF